VVQASDARAQCGMCKGQALDTCVCLCACLLFFLRSEPTAIPSATHGPKNASRPTCQKKADAVVADVADVAVADVAHVADVADADVADVAGCPHPLQHLLRWPDDPLCNASYYGLQCEMALSAMPCMVASSKTIYLRR